MSANMPQDPYSSVPPYGTPPPVPPPMPVVGAYAGFWRRFLAVFIDGILVGIVAGVLGGITGGSFMVSNGGVHYSTGNSGLQTILTIVYEGLLIAFRNGQTIGKLAMGIRVISAGGQPVSVGMAFARAAMKIISGLVLLLGYLWMLWDPNKQTWHDKVAGTYVVRTSR